MRPCRIRAELPKRAQMESMESREHGHSPYPGAIPTPSPSPHVGAPYGDALPEGPIHPGSGRKRIDWRRIFGPFAAAGLLIAKFAAKLKALLLLLPKVKLLTTSASMVVSIAA